MARGAAASSNTELSKFSCSTEVYRGRKPPTNKCIMQYSAPVVEQNNNNEIKKGREYNEKKRESKSRIPCACYGVVVCSTLYFFKGGKKTRKIEFLVPCQVPLPPCPPAALGGTGNGMGAPPGGGGPP